MQRILLARWQGIALSLYGRIHLIRIFSTSISYTSKSNGQRLKPLEERLHSLVIIDLAVEGHRALVGENSSASEKGCQ